MAKGTIRVDKDGYVLLSAFYDLLDISKVEYYEMKLNKDKALTVKFYDKKKKVVKLYDSKE